MSSLVVSHTSGWPAAYSSARSRVGSNLTRYGKPGAAGYAAGKAAVESLTRTLAVELGPSGIRVNAVAPGTTRTAMTADSFADSGRHQELVAMSPLGRLGEPEDVGRAIAVLASDAARHITGSVVVVDGDRSVR